MPIEFLIIYYRFFKGFGLSYDGLGKIWIGDIDCVTKDTVEDKQINVGIAIITPVVKLIEVLESEAVKLLEAQQEPMTKGSRPEGSPFPEQIYDH